MAGTPTFKIGDAVLYVPAEAHALDRDANGDFPWVLGWRRLGKEGVEELTSERADEVVKAIRRSPDPAKARERLSFVRPAKRWPATVRAVRGETLDLDVAAKGGVTLHYDGVPISLVEMVPHSCHAKA